jgi:hypothetical protein
MRTTLASATVWLILWSFGSPVGLAGERRAVERRVPDEVVEAIVRCERDGISDCSAPGSNMPDLSLQAPSQIVRALIVDSQSTKLQVLLPSSPALTVQRTAHGYRNQTIQPFTLREIREVARKGSVVLHYSVRWQSRSKAEVNVNYQSPADFAPNPSVVRVAGCGEIRYFVVRKGSQWTCRRPDDQPGR